MLEESTWRTESLRITFVCVLFFFFYHLFTHTHTKTQNTNTGTLVFAISDGAVPGSNGRNYVLRRVLRRAVRFGQQQLGIEPGFMAKLVNTVVSHMKSAFPEIEAREKYVVEVIRKEEETFNRTVKKGIRKFKQVTSKMKPGDVLSGEDAYKLWSTFGFPKELTELMIEEVKMKMCTWSQSSVLLYLHNTHLLYHKKKSLE